MKLETANLLKTHHEAGKFQVESKDSQVEFQHDFSDAEMLELVEAEYGTSIVQPVPDLFRAIIKDLLKTAIEFAKKDSNAKAD